MNHHRLRALAEFIYRNFPFVAHVTFMQMEIKGYVMVQYDEGKDNLKHKSLMLL